ncbi:MAG: hypothetical protein KI785_08230 [Devosiaceae bacterium]|nr:hypothetical protein [Devosiaceae bacterium MH13]
MSLTIILAILSGLLFGSIAAGLRRFVLPIIALPLAVAPIGYVVWWRHALTWECLYAETFRTAACGPTRNFIETTIYGLPQAALGAAVHLAVGVALTLALMVVRKSIEHWLEKPVTRHARGSVEDALPEALQAQPAPSADPVPA